MNSLSKALLLLCCLTSACSIYAATDNSKIAVSLSYDDALASQLDNALPALNKYNFKASFYLVPNSETITSRLSEWRKATQQGHELGNHSLFHPCSASKPSRAWVSDEQNLDHYSTARVIREVLTANVFLQAIDGKTQRTFTPPCFDTQAAGNDFIEPLRAHFVAIKGVDDSEHTVLWAPVNVTGQQLIDYVKNVPENVRLINLLFHGIGGDHLSVSVTAHAQLLAYLAANKDQYYVDSYINIMKKQEKE
ncbi:polysaccharide deacetylase [Pseudoalteromonas sp. S1727]|uniref:polysaccharide deacetylase family protein n=1 Tax=Pseudoalteromonas sp. S1727 TaxID=2066514 RepID=UPI0011084213|nr:polysaccharide deacetylase family protein [Pseudoalteromonas sp. S1727]TMN71958.1 polysaccharide deacetylase [Pseudoalteromonas sp. S1727]